jgi:hypothetical protein
VKFLVVPDLSPRCTGVMAVLGSFAFGFSAAIFGSFQVVIEPLKIPAIVAGDRFSSETPSRW